MDARIKEARSLVEAALHASDRRRYSKLLEWAKRVLAPLAEENVPEAVWMLASLPAKPDSSVSLDEFDRRYFQQAEEAARLGSAEAMFYLGCELDCEPTVARSSRYFEAASGLGHTYSTWCFGLNLLSGHGTARNVSRGMALVRQAAEERFEGAIQFISRAYEQGSYGLPRDEAAAAAWLSKLKDKDVIHY